MCILSTTISTEAIWLALIGKGSSCWVSCKLLQVTCIIIAYKPYKDNLNPELIKQGLLMVHCDAEKILELSNVCYKHSP